MRISLAEFYPAASSPRCARAALEARARSSVFCAPTSSSIFLNNPRSLYRQVGGSTPARLCPGYVRSCNVRQQPQKSRRGGAQRAVVRKKQTITTNYQQQFPPLISRSRVNRFPPEIGRNQVLSPTFTRLTRDCSREVEDTRARIHRTQARARIHRTQTRARIHRTAHHSNLHRNLCMLYIPSPACTKSVSTSPGQPQAAIQSCNAQAHTGPVWPPLHGDGP